MSMRSDDSGESTWTDLGSVMTEGEGLGESLFRVEGKGEERGGVSPCLEVREGRSCICSCPRWVRNVGRRESRRQDTVGRRRRGVFQS